MSMGKNQVVQITPHYDVEEPFIHPGCVRLTEKVLEQLQERGWELETLKKLREQGFSYCPERDSFFSAEILYVKGGGRPISL